MALNPPVLPLDANHRHIQHQLKLPYVGRVYYVDATNGVDTNGGASPTDAKKTLAAAYALATDFNHDVILILNSGTSGTAETATITWSKSYVHLIGASAPTHMSQRSRVVWTTDSVDPCLTISGNGCVFKDVQIATFQASNDVLASLTGDRNYFENVHFAGIGHATAGDDGTARDLAMTGAVENKFKECTFGLDTIPRSTSNACVEFISSSSKNFFDKCRFQIQPDNVGALFVKSTGAAGISGWNEFKNCLWLAQWTNAADKITAAFNISAQTQTCNVAMTGQHMLIGADDWEATPSGHLWFNSYEAQDATAFTGLAVNNS